MEGQLVPVKTKPNNVNLSIESDRAEEIISLPDNTVHWENKLKCIFVIVENWPYDRHSPQIRTNISNFRH